jgi:predicted nucleotidyltransferase
MEHKLRRAMAMAITAYDEIDELLEELVAAIGQALGPQALGIYLYGSLVTGDFDPVHSDVDLLVVTEGELADAEFAALDALHGAFVTAHPPWYDRIEIAYLSRRALQTFRTQPSPIAIISPGEPFHFKEAGKDWLINWWIVRRQGIALYGPPAGAAIDPIGDKEFQAAVREQVGEWQGYLYEMTRRKSLAYAVLTMCRALHAYVEGEQVSKRAAAAWAAAHYPQWAPLIEDAWAWRVAPHDEEVGHGAVFAATLRFVQFTGAEMGLEPALGPTEGNQQKADDPDNADH